MLTGWMWAVRTANAKALRQKSSSFLLGEGEQDIRRSERSWWGHMYRTLYAILRIWLLLKVGIVHFIYRVLYAYVFYMQVLSRE